jgi:shikimate kinase
VSSGRSVSDIFVESGETTFRALEKDAVAKALAEHDGVLALGGGAVLDTATRQMLSGHRVVYLDVGLAQAMRRLEMNRSRPLLLGNVRTQWQALADARRPFYEEVADQVVATDALTPGQIAKQIADYWQERP